MPIQNVGTLIENLVVAESAAVLLDRLSAGQDLGFATSFAMPALSEWWPHNQAVGISASALRQVAESDGGSEFVGVMRACLRCFPDQGPNAALIVGLLARRRGIGLRLWANDVVDGHYGNAIPSLRSIEHPVSQIDSSITATAASGSAGSTTRTMTA